MIRWGRFIVAAFVAVAVLSSTGCGGTAETVEVTGTGECVVDEDDNYTCTDVMSDDRVSGTEEFHLPDITYTDDGDTTVGTWTTDVVLTNDGGTWNGQMTGSTSWSTTNPEHQHVVDTEFTGTGDYDGLVYHEHIEFIDFPAQITGTIESTS